MIVYPTRTDVRVRGESVTATTYTAMLTDSEGSKYGGGPAHTAVVEPRSLWTKKERAMWREFQHFFRQYENQHGVEKQMIEQEMLYRFGTTSPREYETVLNMLMTADPRLTVTIRRGTVRTTVAEQARYAQKAQGRPK